MRASLFLVASAVVRADVASTLRSALLSESEAQALDVGSIAFDLDLVAKAWPSASRESREARTPQRYGGPRELLVLAFDGAYPSKPDSGLPQEHTKQQQQAMVWLFGQCARLPTSLRLECKKRLAAFGASLEHAAATAPPSTPPRDTAAWAEVSKLQAEAVVAAGLGKRSAFVIPEDEVSAMDDVRQAAAKAKGDASLQTLLAKPEVKAAMERIAADPSAVREYANSPDVTRALEALNGMLQGGQ